MSYSKLSLTPQHHVPLSCKALVNYHSYIFSMITMMIKSRHNIPQHREPQSCKAHPWTVAHAPECCRSDLRMQDAFRLERSGCNAHRFAGRTMCPEGNKLMRHVHESPARWCNINLRHWQEKGDVKSTEIWHKNKTCKKLKGWSRTQIWPRCDRSDATMFYKCLEMIEYLFPCSRTCVLLLDKAKTRINVECLEQLLRVDVSPVQCVRRHHRVHVPDSENVYHMRRKKEQQMKKVEGLTIPTSYYHRHYHDLINF